MSSTKNTNVAQQQPQEDYIKETKKMLDIFGPIKCREKFWIKILHENCPTSMMRSTNQCVCFYPK